MRLPIRRTVLLASLVATPLVAQTRGSNPFHINVAAGAALPTGDFGDAVDAGYAIIAGIGMRQPGSPLGFRAEGMYAEWGISGTDAKTHTGAGIANATYDFGAPTMRSAASTASNTLYAIGGIGWYGTSRSTDIGWNLGGGFRFPLSGFSAYLEARYHGISDAHRSFVPIVFGLVF